MKSTVLSKKKTQVLGRESEGEGNPQETVHLWHLHAGDLPQNRREPLCRSLSGPPWRRPMGFREIPSADLLVIISTLHFTAGGLTSLSKGKSQLHVLLRTLFSTVLFCVLGGAIVMSVK